MEHQITVKFLDSFFRLFKARVEDFKILDNKIFGIIRWLDEGDGQNFVFNENFEPSHFAAMKLLCDFIFENNLIEGDKVVISEIELVDKLINQKWDEIEAKKAIAGLCDLEVKMLDEGEETDSFFIHF